MADVKVKAAAKPVAKTTAAKAVETAAKTEVKTEKKTATKKAATEKAPAKKATTTKKAPAVKAGITIEFNEKSYTTEKLVEIAKDVWVYDLGKDVKDFKTVELYVKPEENAVYYVVNAEVTGCFAI